MSGKHTQGEMSYQDKRPQCGGFSLFAGDQFIGFVSDSDECTDWQANAERLVACWNACDGIDTADLNAAAAELERQHAEIDRLTDAYCGAREDLAIWKRRALEAEEKLRAESAVSSRLASELNAENGPTHMGEPARQSQPLTPLTPGQCVDIADVAAKMEFSDNFLSDICKIVEMVEVAHGIGEKP